MKDRKIIIFSIILFSLFSFSFFSDENDEEKKLSALENLSEMHEIQNLIRKTSYDEALIALYNYIKINPDGFDWAENRIRYIMNQRQKYSETLNELILQLEPSSFDEEKIYEVVRKLNRIEKDPKDERLDFVENAEKLVESAHFQKTFLETLNKAAELVRSNNETEAVNLLLERIYLIDTDGEYNDSLFYHDDFEEESDGILQNEKNQDLQSEEKSVPYPEIYNSVQNLLGNFENSELQNECTQFLEFNFRSFERDINNFIEAIKNKDYSKAETYVTNIKSVINSYAKIRIKVSNRGYELKQNYESLRKIKPEVSEKPYIFFIYRLILGIPSIENSGLVGAADAKIISGVERMKNSCKDEMDSFYNQITQNLLQQNLQSQNVSISKNTINQIQNLAEIYNDTANLYEDLKDENQNPSYTSPNIKINNDYFTGLVNATESLNSTQNEADRIFREWNSINLQINENQYDTVLKKEDAAALLFPLILQIANVEQNTNAVPLINYEWAKIYDDAVKNALETEKPGYSEKTEEIQEDSQNLQNVNSIKISVDNKLRDFSELTEFYESYLQNIGKSGSEHSKDIWNACGKLLCEASELEVIESEEISGTSRIFSEGFLELLSEENVTLFENNGIEGINFALSVINQNQDEKAENVQNEKNSDIEIKYNYPKIALRVNDECKIILQDKINSLNEYILSLQKKENESKTNQNLELESQNFVQKINEEIAKIENLIKNLDSESEIYSETILQAELYKNEGEFTLASATEYLNEGDFENARNSLSKAQESFSRALDLSEDSQIRRISDGQIADLDSRILQAENELVVSEVRSYLTQAQDAYRNTRFEEAETLLLQAQDRWSVTHSESNSEIENLLQYVVNALSVNSGRVLQTSDPLYPEMSQLYSQAEQDFNNKNYESALEKLNQFTNIYPRNQNASVLRLKIIKETYPQKFEKEFSSRIEEAGRLVSQNQADLNDVYADLKDYEKIDSSYPGLSNLIYRIEIQLGIIKIPVDNSSQRRAQELYDRSRRAFNNGNYDSALSLINESINLDSENENATRLKDRITLAIGATTSQVLTSDEERYYSQAILRLSNNDVFGANRIYSNYLANKSNIKKIKDLKRRIDNLL